MQPKEVAAPALSASRRSVPCARDGEVSEKVEGIEVRKGRRTEAHMPSAAVANAARKKRKRTSLWKSEISERERD